MQFDENRILNFEFVHCDCYLQITVVPNKIETGSSNNLIDPTNPLIIIFLVITICSN